MSIEPKPKHFILQMAQYGYGFKSKKEMKHSKLPVTTPRFKLDSSIGVITHDPIKSLNHAITMAKRFVKYGFATSYHGTNWVTLYCDDTALMAFYTKDRRKDYGKGHWVLTDPSGTIALNKAWVPSKDARVNSRTCRFVKIHEE